MTAETLDQETVETLNIRKDIEIAAPIEITFQAVLEELGPGSQLPDGKPFPMKIEPWPGGRWYRDLGNNTGHLWGHVQVIKPPTLLEITGPMPMSYPAENILSSPVMTRQRASSPFTVAASVSRISWSSAPRFEGFEIRSRVT